MVKILIVAARRQLAAAGEDCLAERAEHNGFDGSSSGCTRHSEYQLHRQPDRNMSGFDEVCVDESTKAVYEAAIVACRRQLVGMSLPVSGAEVYRRAV